MTRTEDKISKQSKPLKKELEEYETLFTDLKKRLKGSNIFDAIKKERLFAGGGECRFYSEGITIDIMVPL